MVRLWLCGAVLAIAALPTAISAQSPVPSGTVLDCAVDRADPGLRRSLAGAMMGEGDDAAFDALLGRFSIIADGCTAGLALSDAQKKTYRDYGVARILRDWLAGELAGYGLSGATVDEALDFGPGRRNPALSGAMSEPQVKTLVQAFIEGGIDAENLSPQAWNAVGTYAAASSIYWSRREQLSASTIGTASLPAPSPVITPVAPAVAVVAAPSAPPPSPMAHPAVEPVSVAPVANAQVATVPAAPAADEVVAPAPAAEPAPALEAPPAAAPPVPAIPATEITPPPAIVAEPAAPPQDAPVTAEPAALAPVPAPPAPADVAAPQPVPAVPPQPTPEPVKVEPPVAQPAAPQDAPVDPAAPEQPAPPGSA